MSNCKNMKQLFEEIDWNMKENLKCRKIDAILQVFSVKYPKKNWIFINFLYNKKLNLNVILKNILKVKIWAYRNKHKHSHKMICRYQHPRTVLFLWNAIREKNLTHTFSEFSKNNVGSDHTDQQNKVTPSVPKATSCVRELRSKVSPVTTHVCTYG